MLTPYLMAKNMFDELAESAFGANTLRGMMNTDIKESDQGYELDIDLPGVHKDHLSAELKDEYVLASAPQSNRPTTMTFKTNGICAGNASLAPAAAASMWEIRSNRRISMPSLKTASCACSSPR